MFWGWGKHSSKIEIPSCFMRFISRFCSCFFGESDSEILGFTAKGMENQRYLEHKNNTTNTACMKSIGNVTLQVSEFWRHFWHFQQVLSEVGLCWETVLRRRSMFLHPTVLRPPTTLSAQPLVRDYHLTLGPWVKRKGENPKKDKTKGDIPTSSHANLRRRIAFVNNCHIGTTPN